MEFDLSRVYTAINADELKVGSKVIVADSLKDLRDIVERDGTAVTIRSIEPDDKLYRFETDSNDYALAYLVSEPEKKKLRWEDLEVGDVIHKGCTKSMVIAIDECHTTGLHVLACDSYQYELIWLGNDDLKEWEKVEKGGRNAEL